MGVGQFYDAVRMKQIEDTTVVTGLVDINGNLLLQRRDGVQIDAGHVRGEDGVDGDPGANGLSAYEIWLSDGNTGSISDFLDSLKGVDGETGLPAGAVMAWPASTIPDNWLECNGQEVSRTTYADLFSVIGVVHGAGDGSTTFNVPDYRGATIVGLDSADSDFNVIGKSGGAKAVTLTAAQSGSPAHAHSLPGHTFNWGSSQGGSTVYAANAIATAGNPPSNNLATNQNTFNQSLNSAAVGASQAHPNLQPFKVAKYIIKASGGLGVVSNTVETILLGRVSDLEAWIGTHIPAFEVTHSTSFTGSGAQAFRLFNWNTIGLNLNNCWNSSTSKFTAPVAGLYEFTLSICQASNVGGPEGFLYKNGSALQKGLIAYYNYVTATMTYKLVLAAGDEIQAYWRNNNGTSVTIDGTRSFFSGTLITAY